MFRPYQHLGFTMLKNAILKPANSILHNYLVITDEGVSWRSNPLSQRLAKFLRKHPKLLLKEVEPAKLLMGGECGVPSATYARFIGDLLRPSRSILDSPHVQLLRAYREDGEEIFAPGRFETTAYYENSAKCIELYGNSFAAKDPRDIVKKARKFCQMADGKMYGERDMGESWQGSAVVIRRIRYSDCYEIIDGHHRLAVACVNGKATYSCFVDPSDSVLTPVQQMVLDSNWTGGQREVYQPISAPEVADWPVARRCDDRFKMMTNYLDKIGVHAGTYLDVCCSYGWFVSRMASRGFQALGIDRDHAAVSMSRIAFRLPESATRAGDIVGFLNTNRKDRYDIVSCFSILHHFVLGSMSISAAEFIKKVDEMTGSVLFLDTGQCHESWFAKTLAGWDAEYIRSWLRQHTSFDQIEILGRDSDNVGRFRDQYQRHLFVCRRGG
jgi:2-polyprenyl-3-methyl-5-hydroxy-6-metoxy-1,4-benzoquinol methylase